MSASEGIMNIVDRIDHLDHLNCQEMPLRSSSAVARKRLVVAGDDDPLSKKAKALKERTPIKAENEYIVIPVSVESRARPTVSLDMIRKRILGQRIARSMACSKGLSTLSDSYCFGKVISVICGDELDDDVYRVYHDDGNSEDLNTLTLFDAILLYWKLVPFLNDFEPPRTEVLADWIFENSPRVREFKYCLFEQERNNIDTPRVVKLMANSCIFGTIVKCGPVTEFSRGKSDTGSRHSNGIVWTTVFDNGDVDEMDIDGVRASAALYHEYSHEDPTPINTEHIGMHEAYFPKTLWP